jgi:Tfp pilus assembly protein PilN
LLQQELLTVSGIMDKSMITNQVLDSLDVKDLLKSADFHAAQNINQI